MIRELISGDCLLLITADTDSDAGTRQNSETRQRIRQCQSRTRPGLPFIISLNDDDELLQEMSHYQKERCWLQARIENLERDNRELQKALETLNPNSDNFIPAQGDAGADANAEDSVNYLFVNELK